MDWTQRSTTCVQLTTLLDYYYYYYYYSDIPRTNQVTRNISLHVSSVLFHVDQRVFAAGECNAVS